jgi:hypothetical protein
MIQQSSQRVASVVVLVSLLVVLRQPLFHAASDVQYLAVGTTAASDDDRMGVLITDNEHLQTMPAESNDTEPIYALHNDSSGSEATRTPYTNLFLSENSVVLPRLSVATFDYATDGEFA